MPLTKPQIIALVSVISVIVLVAVIVPSVLLTQKKPEAPNSQATKPGFSPAEPIQWAYLTDSSTSFNTWKTLKADSQDACRDKCLLGFDLFSYNGATKECVLKYFDKVANSGSFVKGATKGMITGVIQDTAGTLLIK